MLDNLLDWSLVLKYRALVQAKVDMHILVESATRTTARPPSWPRRKNKRGLEVLEARKSKKTTEGRGVGFGQKES